MPGTREKSKPLPNIRSEQNRGGVAVNPRNSWVDPLNQKKIPSRTEVEPLAEDLVTPFVDEQDPTMDQYIASLKLGNISNPTWNPDFRDVKDSNKKIGGWVDATPERDGGIPNDERMVTGRILNPSLQNTNLMQGELSDEALNEITPEQVAQINPISDVPRKILKNTLKESWHDAKHKLIDKGDTASNKEARNLLMTKLERTGSGLAFC